MSAKEKLIEYLTEEGCLKTPQIIKAFRAIDRADFVLPEYLGEAYGNYPLPIGEGQTISQPLTVAFMLELLEPRAGEKILDIGSGSGWTTALLAHAVGEKGRVLGIERMGKICEFGKKNLVKYFDEPRAKIICGDGTLGSAGESPYDKILAGASASREIPKAWREQLKVGGKIVAPVGGSIWLFIKKSETEWEEKEFPGFSFVPLVKDASRPKTQNAGQTLDPDPPEFKRFGLWLENFNFASGVTPRILHFLKARRAAIALVLAGISVIAGLLLNEIYRPHTSFRGYKTVEIQTGLGSVQISELLKKEGVIRSKWVFELYLSLKGETSDLRPGFYTWGKVAIPEIARDLIRGGANEISLTIPEGWSNDNIASYLDGSKIISGEEFKKASGRAEAEKLKNKFDFLKDKPPNAGLEGYLFPDTYRIYRNSGAEDLIVKTLENFDKKLTPDLRAEISRQHKTIFEIVTMASLIEKEVVSDQDRVVVSGILWKRLDAGIPLQVDASIAYLTGKKTTTITQNDLRIDSFYNTYKYRGLPLGPISNPGISAVKAAIYPQKSPYLYYLSTPDGKTIFSQTLEEHNKAKTKYLK